MYKKLTAIPEKIMNNPDALLQICEKHQTKARSRKQSKTSFNRSMLTINEKLQGLHPTNNQYKNSPKKNTKKQTSKHQ